MTMTVDIKHAILAGFVEMILIAQTVIFMIFIRFPLMT